jgi:hypothetical protein
VSQDKEQNRALTDDASGMRKQTSNDIDRALMCMVIIAR